LLKLVATEFWVLRIAAKTFETASFLSSPAPAAANRQAQTLGGEMVHEALPIEDLIPPE
jgi:hypothetical protein